MGLYGPELVLLPAHGIGLPHSEVTIAEALRDFAGYSTGIVGKWHLGGLLFAFIFLSFTPFVYLKNFSTVFLSVLRGFLCGGFKSRKKLKVAVADSVQLSSC